MSRYVLTLAMLVAFVSMALAVPATTAPIAQAPIGFMENKGQVVDQFGKPHNEVLFLLNSPGLGVQLRRDGFSYDAMQARTTNADALDATADRRYDAPVVSDFHRVDITFVGAHADGPIVSSIPSDDLMNFYTQGVDENGITGVRHFSCVTYKELYPGIDLVFNITERDGAPGVEYDFILRPGADLAQVRMQYDGAPVQLASNGDMILKTAFGDLIERIPASWHILGKSRIGAQVVAVMLDDRTVGFRSVGTERAPQGSTLVIDPVPSVTWSTMYGGTAYDGFIDVGIDASGNTLACGGTQSSNAIATAGAHQGIIAGGQDGMLVKMNAAGARVWATYFGGSGSDTGLGLSNDASGNIYMCGTTASASGISTTGAFKTTLGGTGDGFLVKFSSAGTRLWGTYYGGTGDDDASEVACDGAGDPVFVGDTESLTGIASTGAADVSYGGSGDAYVAKFNSSGARQWATYLGGAGEDHANGTSNDGTFIYLVGSTASTTGIALGATHQVIKSGGTDGYLVKYSGLGAKLWATFYGGIGDDSALGCLAEPSTGRIYICGSTFSTGSIATVGSHDATFNGNSSVSDGFLAKIDNTGAREWGTYYGGIGTDWLEDIAIGYTGRIYVSGYTTSSSGIATSNVPQPNLTFATSAFITRFNTSGSRIWGTYFNGSDNWMYSRCAARDAAVVLGGDTRSQTTTTAGCHQATFGGGIFDGYLVRFNDPLFQLMPPADDGAGARLLWADDKLLIISDPTEQETPADVTVFDAMGRTAATWSGMLNGELVMDVPNAAPGCYVVRIARASVVESGRFVKP
ncbi:MAG: SBBP repeat-containing protein [Flavobacteriales bacterium]